MLADSLVGSAREASVTHVGSARWAPLGWPRRSDNASTTSRAPSLAAGAALLAAGPSGCPA
eukprot:10726559-Lingulodinium_polyedra.AAC.1